MRKFNLVFALVCSITVFSSGTSAQDLYPVQSGSSKKFGFRDERKRLAIPYRYDTAFSFHEGKAAVAVYGKDSLLWFGFIDPQGKLVIPYRFFWASDFHDSLARVKDFETGLWGYIDHSGIQAVAFRYRSASNFSQGMAAVMDTGGRIVYINRNGETVITLESYIYAARGFRDGFAAVQDAFDKWTFIDKEGKEIHFFDFEDCADFSEGLAAVKKAGKWGFMDTTGRIVFGFVFDGPAGFRNGVAEVIYEGKRILLWNDPSDRRRFGYSPEDNDAFSKKSFWGKVKLIFFGFGGIVFLFWAGFYLIFSFIKWGLKGVYRRSVMAAKMIYYGFRRKKFHAVRDAVMLRNADIKRVMDDFYRSKLESAILSVEKQRKAGLARHLLFLAGAVVVSIFAAKIHLAIVLSFPVFFLIFFLLSLVSLEMKLRTMVQDTVIPPLIRFINKDLKYSPGEGLTRDEVTSCSVLSDLEWSEEFESQNLIEGTSGNVAFRVAEVKASRSRDVDKEIHPFRGVLFIARFHKDISATTLCRHDGRPFRRESSLKKITLENLEFNAYFETFSNDDLEARYILTPAMMERMLTVQVRLGEPSFFIFEKNRIYLGTADFFHMNLFKPIRGLWFAENYYHFFRLFLDVVDELHLNLNIWPKARN